MSKNIENKITKSVALFLVLVGENLAKFQICNFINLFQKKKIVNLNFLFVGIPKQISQL